MQVKIFQINKTRENVHLIKFTFITRALAICRSSFMSEVANFLHYYYFGFCPGAREKIDEIESSHPVDVKARALALHRRVFRQNVPVVAQTSESEQMCDFFASY